MRKADVDEEVDKSSTVQEGKQNDAISTRQLSMEKRLWRIESKRQPPFIIESRKRTSNTGELEFWKHSISTSRLED